VLLDDTEDGPALLAPTGSLCASSLGGALRQCALPGFCTLRLLVGGNGGELAFGRFEFSIDIGHLLERSVMHLVRGSNRSSDREDGTITTTYGCCTDLP
jgi:hypothetical protein